MNPYEVYVVYGILAESILSVHPNYELALARKNKMDLKNPRLKAVTLVCDLESAVEFLVEHRKQ